MTRINRYWNDAVEITKPKRGTNEKYILENDRHGNGIFNADSLRPNFGVRSGR